MKALDLSILTLALSMATSFAAESEDFTSLCRLFKSNTVIAMPGTCDKYIKCNTSGQGKVFSCSSPMGYDVKTQSCKDKFDNSDMCANPCAGKDGIWIADGKSCNGYYYCQNGVHLVGRCDDPFHFDETKQMCVHAETSTCVGVSNICALVPDKTKFRNEKDCRYYYECLGQKIKAGDCKKSSYFDVESQSCVEKKKVNCTAHHIPENICIEKKKPFHGFRADQATCRGYFYCANLGAVEDLEPIWGQCPEGKFFSEPHQNCVHPTDAKCGFNRCEGRGNLMVSSSNNNCHNYLICENGHEVEEKTCPYDYFFDELYQACVPDIIYYECCDIK